jgi:hypothetical protein
VITGSATVPALGTRFVDAVAARDADGLAAVVHPQIDFHALTPRRLWEASDPDAVLEIVLGHWFEPSDELDSGPSASPAATGRAKSQP